MKNRTSLMCIGFLALAGTVFAEPPPFVSSAEQGGCLVWTNASSTQQLYRVLGEVAPGQWQATWQQAQGVQMPTSGAVTIPAPVQFGVLLFSNRPPSGMVLIEEGEVVRGSEGVLDEQPIHTNFLRSFYVDRFEVPYALWARINDWAYTNGYTDISLGASGWVQSLGDASSESNHPVVYITWREAVKWCNARSEAEGLVPAIYLDAGYIEPYRLGETDELYLNVNANGYRLPTEAEWEKAARGGLVLNYFPWPSQGGDMTNHLKDIYANFSDSYDLYEAGTTPVGWYNGSQWISYFFTREPARDMANGYGLYDMAGNVSEWCWDWYDSMYYENKVYDNPLGPPSSLWGRVVRGGSWYANSLSMRCSARSYHAAGQAATSIGFRCVRRADLLQ